MSLWYVYAYVHKYTYKTIIKYPWTQQPVVKIKLFQNCWRCPRTPHRSPPFRIVLIIPLLLFLNSLPHRQVFLNMISACFFHLVMVSHYMHSSWLLLLHCWDSLMLMSAALDRIFISVQHSTGRTLFIHPFHYHDFWVSTFWFYKDGAAINIHEPVPGADMHVSLGRSFSRCVPRLR